MELSKKTVTKETFYERENISHEPEDSMLKPYEVKTQEPLPEVKSAPKPHKRMELAPARGTLG